jgi:hypothetical protein
MRKIKLCCVKVLNPPHVAEIKSLYPEKYIEGGVGKIIEI